MFQKDQLSVFDWIGYYILMAIPLVNIIVLLVIMFSSNSNETLRNMLWSQVLLVVLVFAAIFFLFAGLVPDIWNIIQELISTIRQYIGM
ncbi:MAG: hypothetical protein JXB08_00125 [Bacilli bacterium]|nr:hypothetical protein [Bacilli bacterium]MBN2876793.1 hypothetical protein [Bacilli bacterium]